MKFDPGNWFFGIPRWLDECWRTMDLRVNATDGRRWHVPKESKDISWHKGTIASGLPLLAMLVPLPVYATLLFGPLLSAGGDYALFAAVAVTFVLGLVGTRWWAIGLLAGIAVYVALLHQPPPAVKDWLAPTTFAATTLLTIAASRFLRGKWWRGSVFVLLLGVSGVVWYAAGDNTELVGVPYRHALVPFSLAFAGLILIGYAMACWMFSKRRAEEIRRALPLPEASELLRSSPKNRPAGNRLAFIRALTLTVLESPLLLVLPATVAVVFAPAGTEHLVAKAAFIIAVTLFFLAALHYDARHLFSIKTILQRLAAEGTARVLSFALVILAALRLLKVSYATTILETGQWTIVLGVLVSCYGVVWLLDVLQFQFLAELLMQRVLTDPSGPEQGIVKLAGNGELLIHGAGRFAARPSIKMKLDASQQHKDKVSLSVEQRTETYPFSVLFRRLRQNSTAANAGAAGDVVQEKIRVYFGSRRALTVVVVLFWYWVLRPDPVDHLPNLGLRDSSPAPFSLKSAISDHAGDTSPLYLLAASGGGTRAAMFTEGLLRKLHDHKVLGRVVLASGVSGGSAALSYFGRNRKKLLEDEGWDAFESWVQEPFIDDVLRGSFEYRLFNGTRNGVLLAESFDFHAHPLPTVKMGQVENLGLMFNTGLCAETAGAKGPAHTRYGGSRLVLSNVEEMRTNSSMKRPAFMFRAFHDPDISLTWAASLSANFPPVFWDALLQERGDKERKYLVTDGGAVENRGLLAVLATLRETVTQLDPSSARTPWPELVILVADASAFSHEYNGVPGLSAASGAKLQLANGLIAELSRDVDQAYRAKGGEGVRVELLPMPDSLRHSTAFGTHWRMPAAITLHAPVFGPVPPKSCAAPEMEIGLDEEHAREVTTLMRDLWNGLDKSKLLRRPDAGCLRAWMRVNLAPRKKQDQDPMAAAEESEVLELSEALSRALGQDSP